MEEIAIRLKYLKKKKRLEVIQYEILKSIDEEIEEKLKNDFTDLANVSCDITVHLTQPQDSPSAMRNSML